MTEELIKEVKHIQKCLINKGMEGEEWEEKMERRLWSGCIV